MKKPFQEKFISDYFRGVLPQAEINKMMDESNAQSLEWLEMGVEISWEVFFEMKVIKRWQYVTDKIGEALNVTAAN